MTSVKKEKCNDCNRTLKIYETDHVKGRLIKKCPKCSLYYYYKKDILGNWSLKKIAKPDFVSGENNETIKVETRLSKNVFIVHGRDKQPALELARILERRFGLVALFLQEQAHRGKTIPEQLEEHSDVQYAFVIITPDDVGALKGEKMRSRARQNVILEFGLFVGKIGRKKITILLKGDVELPSDMRGILYSRFHESPEECYLHIERDLKAAGFKIKL